MSSIKNNYVFDLGGTLLVGGTTVSISNDLELNQVVTFTNASVVFRNRDATTIERAIGTAAGGTLTLSKRGLEQVGEVENIALQKEWKEGTRCYVTVLSHQIVDKKASNTFSGTQSFDTINAEKVVASVYTRDAVYANATARDAAIPSPQNGMRIYNTQLGLFQKHQAGAWVDDTSGGSTPNASTTVAGKAEKATQAEVNAGTSTGGTGAELFVGPAEMKTYVDGQTSNIDGKIYLYNQLGDGVVGDIGIVDINKTNVTFGQRIGEVSSNKIVAGYFYSNGLANTNITTDMIRIGSPTDLKCEIQTLSSGLPTGNIVSGTSLYTIPTSSIVTTSSSESVTFNSSIGFTATSDECIFIFNTTRHLTNITITTNLSVSQTISIRDGSGLLVTTFATPTASLGNIVLGPGLYYVYTTGGSGNTSTVGTVSSGLSVIYNRCILGFTATGYTGAQITFSAPFTIPKGKYAIVFYVGSKGSEIINNTSYYIVCGSNAYTRDTYNILTYNTTYTKTNNRMIISGSGINTNVISKADNRYKHLYIGVFGVIVSTTATDCFVLKNGQYVGSNNYSGQYFIGQDGQLTTSVLTPSNTILVGYGFGTMYIGHKQFNDFSLFSSKITQRQIAFAEDNFIGNFVFSVNSTSNSFGTIYLQEGNASGFTTLFTLSAGNYEFKSANVTYICKKGFMYRFVNSFGASISRTLDVRTYQL